MKEENHQQQRFEKWVTAAAVAAMLAYFVRVILRHYFLRASSDPHNWLMYAYHFGTEVLKSRWPYGFPLFLRLMLPLTGPYAIFLINLPLLVLAFILIGRLAGSESGNRETPPYARLAGLLAMALALTADARELIQYVNPYRDPLSYVLLLASAWVFARALAARRPIRLALAGILLGLACSVREPSVLMLLPLALYGIIEWGRDRHGVPFRASVVSFATGFILALVPLAIQTWLATHQMLLPPQAAMQASIVPGAHLRWHVFSSVSVGAWQYYQHTQVWIPLLAAVGLLTAIKDRHRLMLFLIAPATVIYFVFYSFYWTFVPRYFYIATLLSCILGGYGATGLLRLLTCHLPAPWGRRAAWTAALLSCFLGARHFRQVQRPQPPLQIADARAFANDLAPLVPTNAVVFSQRNLCELIQVVGRRESYAWAFDPDMIREHIQERWAEGRPVYTMEVPSPAFPYGDTIHLRRLYDLVRIATFSPETYNMAGFASGPFHLHRIRTPDRRRTAIDIEAPAQDKGWLVVDPGYLRALDPDRTFVNILVNGTVVADATHWIGAEFTEIDLAERPAGPLRVEFASDGPLPADVRAAAGDPSAPVALDFDLHATFDHRWRWQGGILPPDLMFRKPRLENDAFFLLPRLTTSSGRTVMEWHFRSTARRKGGTENIRILEGDSLLAELTLPRDHQIHEFMVDLPAREQAAPRRIRIIREQPDIGIPPELEIHRLILHRPGMQRSLDLDIGSLADALYIHEGLYHREGAGTPHAYRWTNGKATLRLPALQMDGDRRLRVHYAVEHTPPARRPMPMTIRWNGQERAPAESWTSTDGLDTVLTLHIPYGDVRPDNHLSLETMPWNPREHGGADSRRLGVILRRLEWGPIE